MTEPTHNQPSELATMIHGEKKKYARSRKLLWWMLAVFLLAGTGFYFFSQSRSGGGEGPTFVTEPLARGDIRKTITATGNLAPTNEVTVGSELSGTTLEVYVESNDTVVAGQALAQLDTTALENQLKANRANLASAQASVSQANATLAEAKAVLERQKELRKISNGKIPSQSVMDSAVASLERAEANVLSAEASVQQQEAQVQITETDLAKTVLRSPTNGVVLSRDLEPGQTVAASFTAPELFVIAEDLTSMILEVSIAEADIGLVDKGMAAQFQVDAWAQRTYTASVSKVSFGSEVTDNVVTYPTELIVSNKDLSLRPGMTATADIEVASSENVFLVSVAALRFQPPAPDEDGQSAASSGGSKSFVERLMPRQPRRGAGGGGPRKIKGRQKTASAIWVLRDGAPERIPVSIGLSDGSRTEVSSDQLQEGDAVILREDQVR